MSSKKKTTATPYEEATKLTNEERHELLGAAHRGLEMSWVLSLLNEHNERVLRAACASALASGREYHDFIALLKENEVIVCETCLNRAWTNQESELSRHADKAREQAFPGEREAMGWEALS